VRGHLGADAGAEAVIGLAIVMVVCAVLFLSILFSTGKRWGP
jgi:hypothetical protein